MSTIIADLTHDQTRKDSTSMPTPAIFHEITELVPLRSYRVDVYYSFHADLDTLIWEDDTDDYRFDLTTAVKTATFYTRSIPLAHSVALDFSKRAAELAQAAA